MEHSEVDIRPHEPLPGRALREHPAPGVHHHAVPEGAVPGIVLPLLRGGEDEHLALDGACAKQDLPVRGPGRRGEVGRHADYLRAPGPQVAIELGEAQIEADGEGDASDRGLDHGRGRRARLDGVALLCAHPRQVHVEELALSIVREQRSVLADENRRVVHPFGVSGNALVQAAQKYGESVAGRPLPKLGNDGTVERLRRRELRSPAGDAGEHLGIGEEPGASGHRLVEQGQRTLEIGRDIRGAGHLGERNAAHLRHVNSPNAASPCRGHSAAWAFRSHGQRRKRTEVPALSLPMGENTAWQGP